MDRLKIIEAKRLRGILIKSLYDAYPGGLLKGTLKRAFTGNYSGNDIDRQLEYLKGKAYIETDNCDDCNDEQTLIKISSNGIDLMEETIEDAGVEF